MTSQDLVYRDFTQEVLDALYDNTKAVKNSTELLKDFDERSAALAAQYPSLLDIPYGNRPRQKLDYFISEERKFGAPLFVFIHGGYWQMRCKETFRFLAKGPLALGFHVANVGYTLAPEASLTEIVAEIREAIDWLRSYAHKFGADTTKIVVSGWSAGGHLAASVLDMPDVCGALAISGIYDLEPISKSYLNKALSLTTSEIATLSPIRNAVVKKPMAIVCGSSELSELQRQSVEFSSYRTQAAATNFSVLQNKNHFTILTELENPDGELSKMLKGLM